MKTSHRITILGVACIIGLIASVAFLAVQTSGGLVVRNSGSSFATDPVDNVNANRPVYENAPDASNSANLPEVRAWARKLAEAGEEEYKKHFGSAGGRLPSPQDWRDHVVYQVMVDRFNNGDGTNDRTYWNGGRLEDTMFYRHGGDFKGIQDRLPYLSDLGIGAIYMNPIAYQNYGDYHGYCTANHVRLQEEHGTMGDFQDMVRAAHDLGIRIIVDFTINHMCSASLTIDNSWQCKLELYEQAKNQKTVDGSGTVPGQGTINFQSNFFPPMKNQKYFSRCGGDGFTDDPRNQWFGRGWDGLTDFNSNDPDTRLMVTEFAKYLIAVADIDGYRLDAAKHVTPGFIAYFSTHVRDYALSVGKDNFMLIGEVLSPDDQMRWYMGNMDYYESWILPGTKATIAELEPLWSNTNQKQRFPGLTSGYDGGHHYQLNNLIKTNNPGTVDDRVQELINYFNWDNRKATEARSNTYWIYVSNHDKDRAMTVSSDPNYNQIGRAIVIQFYVLMAKFVPVIYYGDEQGFNQACGDVSGLPSKVRNACSQSDVRHRQAMWEEAGWNLGSVVPSINSLRRIAKPASSATGRQNNKDWTEDPFLDRSHDLYKIMRKTMNVRKSCNALRRSEQYMRRLFQGIIAFSRISGDTEAIVVINPTTISQTVNDILVDYNLNNGKGGVVPYQNLLASNEQVFSTQFHGSSIKLSFGGNFVMQPFQVAIFVEKANVRGWDSNIEAFLCKDVDVTVPDRSPTPSPVPVPTSSPVSKEVITIEVTPPSGGWNFASARLAGGIYVSGQPNSVSNSYISWNPCEALEGVKNGNNWLFTLVVPAIVFPNQSNFQFKMIGMNSGSTCASQGISWENGDNKFITISPVFQSNSYSYQYNQVQTEITPLLPTPAPQAQPTRSPTPPPQNQPTRSPTKFPTKSPTKFPTKEPTMSPVTRKPTVPGETFQPTVSPTSRPSASPTTSPTKYPTSSPSVTAPPTDFASKIKLQFIVQQPLTGSWPMEFEAAHLVGGLYEKNDGERIPVPWMTWSPCEGARGKQTESGSWMFEVVAPRIAHPNQGQLRFKMVGIPVGVSCTSSNEIYWEQPAEYNKFIEIDPGGLVDATILYHFNQEEKEASVQTNVENNTPTGSPTEPGLIGTPPGQKEGNSTLIIVAGSLTAMMTVGTIGFFVYRFRNNDSMLPSGPSLPRVGMPSVRMPSVNFRRGKQAGYSYDKDDNDNDDGYETSEPRKGAWAANNPGFKLPELLPTAEPVTSAALFGARSPNGSPSPPFAMRSPPPVASRTPNTFGSFGTKPSSGGNFGTKPSSGNNFGSKPSSGNNFDNKPYGGSNFGGNKPSSGGNFGTKPYGGSNSGGVGNSPSSGIGGTPNRFGGDPSRAPSRGPPAGWGKPPTSGGGNFNSNDNRNNGPRW